MRSRSGGVDLQAGPRAPRRLRTCAAILLAVSANAACAGLDDIECEYKRGRTPAVSGVTSRDVRERLASEYYAPADEESATRGVDEFVAGASYDPGPLREDERRCLELAYSRAASDDEEETEFDGKLAAVGMGDRNHNGIPDFLVGKFGRLYENDVDVDGDGIPNSLDLHPFMKEPDDGPSDRSGDADGDGIPDHLDWSGARGKNAALASVQACLYRRGGCATRDGAQRDLGILLIDTDAEFELKTAESIRDALLRVLDGCTIESLEFCSDRSARLETLERVYASRNAYVQTRDRKPSTGRRGEVLLGNRAMHLYERSNGNPPEGEARVHDLLRFLSVAHEILHAVQYAFDYPENLAEVQRENIYRTPEYIAYMNDTFGDLKYSTKSRPVKSKRPSHVLFNDIDEFPYVTTHDGVSFDDLYHDYPPKDPSAIGRDSRYREANVIRRYAFVNVFEWHAVQLEAYLVRLMVDDRLKSAFRDDPAGRERERERIHHALHCVRGGIYYDYANEEVMERMAEAFPIDEADLRYLTERYLPTSVELGIEDTRACPY